MMEAEPVTRRLSLFLLVALTACGGGPGPETPEPAGEAEPAVRSEPVPEPTGRRVLIIGLDGADMRLVRRLSKVGRLPHLTGLMRRGVAGRLITVESSSPIIWTSVATGMMPEKHGITFFRKDGEPAASTMRKRPALWNILSHYQRTVGIMGWWVTFPAERVNGYMVSPYIVLMPPREHQARVGRLWDPGDPRKAYPPELVGSLDELIRISEDMTAEEMGDLYVDEIRTTNTRWVLAKDLSYHDIAKKLLVERPTDLAAVYFQGIDAASHDFDRHVHGKNINRKRPSKVSPAERKAAMERVHGMYELSDRMVGELLEAAGPETDVIVLSDHGWQYDGTSHWNNDPGVFIAAGPSFVSGPTPPDLSVLDVAPVVLTILGVPMSRRFDGRLPEGVIVDELFGGASWVADYDIPAVALPEDTSSEAAEDEEMIRRLETLGYIE